MGGRGRSEAKRGEAGGARCGVLPCQCVCVHLLAQRGELAHPCGNSDSGHCRSTCSTSRALISCRLAGESSPSRTAETHRATIQPWSHLPDRITVRFVIAMIPTSLKVPARSLLSVFCPKPSFVRPTRQQPGRRNLSGLWSSA